MEVLLADQLPLHPFDAVPASGSVVKRAKPPPAPKRALTSIPPQEDPIVLPRSKRRPVATPRKKLEGESPESLGSGPITRAERRLALRDRWHLMVYSDVRFGPPADDRDCPQGPCPHVGCRHHFYVDVDGKRLTLNFPGRHVDEIRETCSLRAARAVALKREASERPDEPALSCVQIGKFMNLTQETVRLDLKRGLAKLKAAGIDLGEPTKKGTRD